MISWNLISLPPLVERTIPCHQLEIPLAGEERSDSDWIPAYELRNELCA